MFGRSNRPKLNRFLIIVVILCVLVTALILLEHFQKIGRTDPDYAGKTVWHNGVAYFPRQDLDLFLIMGIDRKGPVVDSGSYNNDGAADTVMLVIFNQTTRKFDILSLNRDSMVDMPVLGFHGEPAGTVNAQLALSHTYGNGLHASCENTVATVSELLCGIQIDHYLSMNMDVVSILNDAIGGVRVNVTDDFSHVDSSIPMGEVTLNGQQALNFVQLRKDVEDELNISRMRRQREYMRGFFETYKANNHGITDSLEVFDSIDPYIVTNCTDKALAALLDDFKDYQFGEIIIPEGENVIGETYMEFHLDKDALLELTLQLLYEPK